MANRSTNGDESIKVEPLYNCLSRENQLVHTWLMICKNIVAGTLHKTQIFSNDKVIVSHLLMLQIDLFYAKL